MSTFNRNLHLSDSVSHIQMIVNSCLKLTSHLPMNILHMLCSVAKSLSSDESLMCPKVLKYDPYLITLDLFWLNLSAEQ